VSRIGGLDHAPIAMAAGDQVLSMAESSASSTSSATGVLFSRRMNAMIWAVLVSPSNESSCRTPPRNSAYSGVGSSSRSLRPTPYSVAMSASSEKGVRSAQKTQVGPRIPVGMQLQKAEVGPTSGPTWRLSHFGEDVDLGQQRVVLQQVGRPAELLGPLRGLCGYTRARCYSSLEFLVTIEILHIKEIGEGELQKALV
jgi:hypothetical protein